MEVRTPAVSGTFYPGDEKELKDLIHAVSYTHLTLPTNREV